MRESTQSVLSKSPHHLSTMVVHRAKAAPPSWFLPGDNWPCVALCLSPTQTGSVSLTCRRETQQAVLGHPHTDTPSNYTGLSAVVMGARPLCQLGGHTEPLMWGEAWFTHGAATWIWQTQVLTPIYHALCCCLQTPCLQSLVLCK